MVSRPPALAFARKGHRQRGQAATEVAVVAAVLAAALLLPWLEGESPAALLLGTLLALARSFESWLYLL
jgi:hypothetical protein